MLIAHRNRARLEGPKRLHQSYPNPPTLSTWNMRRYFHSEATTAVREAVLATSSEFQGHLFVANDHVHQLSFPSPKTAPDDSPILVGSISNKLDSPELIHLPATLANQWFVSLHKAPDTTDGAVNIFATATNPVPDQTGPPPPVDGEAEPPSNGRLHFPHTDSRFGYFPVLLPLPIGIDVPPGHPVHVPFPDTLTQSYPFIEDWRRAASWTITHNSGLSADIGGPMFDIDAFIEPTPPHLLANFEITKAPIQVAYNMVPHSTALHTSVISEIGKATDLAWDRLAALLPPAPPTPPVLGAASPLAYSTPDTNILSVLERVVTTQGQTLERALTRSTPAELETSKATSIAMTTYALLMASIDEDSSSVQLGQLHPTFKNVIQHTKTEPAKDDLKLGIKETISKLEASGSNFIMTATLRETMFDTPLTAAIRAARIYSSSFRHEAGPPDARLSILSFASPTGAVAQRALADQEAANYAAVGNDAKDIIVNHKLFTSGRLHNLPDVLSLLANLLVFLNFITTNPSQSELYKLLHHLLMLLSNRENRGVIELNRERQPYIAHSLASKIQDVFACFASFGKAPDAIDAIQNGERIDVASLRKAVNHAKLVVDSVGNACASSMTHFDSEGILWQMLHPKRGPTATTPTSVGVSTTATRPSSQRGPFTTPPPTTGKRTNNGQRKHSPHIEANRAIGFLTTTLTDPASITALGNKCPAFLTTPTGTKERLCFRHVLKDWGCGYGPDCRFPHPMKLDAIDKPNRDKIIQWVNSTPNLQFVPGEGPAVHVNIDYLLPPPPPATNSARLLAPPRPQFQLPHPPPTLPVHPAATAAVLATSAQPTEHFPKYSDVLTKPSPIAIAATQSVVRETYSRSDLDTFASNHLSPRIRATLEQPFGKPNRNQCFKSVATLGHVLCPLLKSRFLSALDWTNFSHASPTAADFLTLWVETAEIDFEPLRGFNPNWESQKELDREQVLQATAALLHRFDGDAGALVRWIGGPHVGAHRDVPRILATLRGTVPDAALAQLERLYTLGMPAVFNADESTANFEAYRRYGNHSSVSEDPDQARTALIKEQKKGWCIVLNPRALPFLLNAHLTPIGLININHAYKKPRLIWDASFRPQPWCNAINDLSDLSTEPPVTFADSFDVFLTYLANLRASYPQEEIYLGEDDVGGAFKHNKFHPDLVSAHASQKGGYTVLATGSTFGGKSSPANWDTIAVCRQHRAQYLWHQPDIVQKAAPYLPPIILANPPTPSEVATFAQIEKDALITGVFDDNGKRLPPPYSHWVDDCSYADVRHHMAQTVSASAIALFDTLGYPDPLVPNALSQDKLNTTYSHQRKIVGLLVDTRSMSIKLLPSKRAECESQLQHWLNKTTYTLREASALIGMVDSMAKYNRWGRTYLSALQHEIRTSLIARYAILNRQNHAKKIKARLAPQLPREARYRLASLVAEHIARALWNDKLHIPTTDGVRANLQLLHNYLADRTNQWEAPIALIIPRVPHATSVGDASGTGGGAYCERLRFWFDIRWSDTTQAALDNGTLDINCLEFLVVILQYVAALVCFRNAPPTLFPSGTPSQFPIVLIQTDNTSAAAWAHKLSASSAKSGHRLILVLAELLRQFRVGINSEHIAGIDNEIADFLSHPDSPSPPRSVRLSQIFQKYNYLQTWNYFLPSPALLRLLCSSLSKKPSAERPVLPKNLGRFVPATSYTSSSPII